MGSTNIRCAVYDIKGNLVSLASCGTEKAYAKKSWGFGEDELPDVVIRLCNEAIQKIEGTFTIHGMAVGCIGCGAMLLNKNGNFVHTKGDYKGLSQKFNKQITPREIFNTTGYSANDDNLAFRIGVHTGEEIDAVLSIADYIAFRLTGEKCREYSTACSMNVWDNHNREWWDYLFQFAKVDKNIFGTVVNSGTEVGTVLPSIAENSFIPRGTKIYNGGHDYLCSAFATGCYNNRTLLNIVGTYEIMASFHDTPWQRQADNFDPIRPIVDNHVLPGLYSYQLETYGAGQTEWLRKNIFKNNQWGDYFSQLENQKATAPSEELFIPNVYGQIVPHVNMDAKGAFLYLSGKTNRISLLKATIEGLCYKSREILEAQKKVMAPGFVIKMTGGGSKSRTWVQTKADILNIPVTVPNIRESTALGAAMLAGVGSGVYTSYEDAIKTIGRLGEETIEPRKELAKRYEEIYQNKYLKMCEVLQ